MQNASELSNIPETESTPGSATYQRLTAALTNEAMLNSTTSGAFSSCSGVNADILDLATNDPASTGPSLTPTITPIDQISAPNELMRRRLSRAERELLTQKSVTPILEQLSFANERLQNAMQRVGYLECQVEVMQETLKGVPELRAKGTRAIILEIENNSLTAKLAEREDQLSRREKQIHGRNQEIELLTKVLDAHKKHAQRVEADLHELEQKPWVKFVSWLTGNGK